MNRAFTVLLACAVFAGVQADFWSSVKDVGSDVGEFFEKSFTDFKSLFASDQGDLEKKVDKVQGLLQTIKEQSGKLSPLASDTQKTAIGKVDGWLVDVNNFKQKITTDGESKFAENKSIWEGKLKTMFEDNHLQSLVALVNSSSYLLAPLLTIVCALGAHFLFNH
jgi:hypothetical protein